MTTPYLFLFARPGTDALRPVEASSLRAARHREPAVAVMELAEVMQRGGETVWVPGDGPWVDDLRERRAEALSALAAMDADEIGEGR